MLTGILVAQGLELLGIATRLGIRSLEGPIFPKLCARKDILGDFGMWRSGFVRVTIGKGFLELDPMLHFMKSETSRLDRNTG
jgi:hypothetical protein